MKFETYCKINMFSVFIRGSSPVRVTKKTNAVISMVTAFFLVFSMVSGISRFLKFDIAIIKNDKNNQM